MLNVSFTKSTGEGTLLFSFARVKDSTVSAPHRGQRHRYQCSQHVDEIKVKLKHSSIEFGIRKRTDEKKNSFNNLITCVTDYVNPYSVQNLFFLAFIDAQDVLKHFQIILESILSGLIQQRRHTKY